MNKLNEKEKECINQIINMSSVAIIGTDKGFCYVGPDEKVVKMALTEQVLRCIREKLKLTKEELQECFDNSLLSQEEREKDFDDKFEELIEELSDGILKKLLKGIK